MSNFPYSDPSNSSEGEVIQPSAPQTIRVATPEVAPYVTYSIIGVTVFVYLLQVASQYFFQVDLPVALFAKSSELIREGQWWRLITPALVHGSLLHIFFNMYALLSFGTGLERHYGHGRFLTLYVLGAFAGNVASFLLVDGISVGASTAIFGLIGAEGIFLYHNRRLFAGQFRNAISNIVFITVINLAYGFSAANIDNAGHIGGLIGGLMFSWFAGPIFVLEGISPNFQLVDQRSSGDVAIGAALVLLVFGGLAVWGMVMG